MNESYFYYSPLFGAKSKVIYARTAENNFLVPHRFQRFVNGVEADI